MLIEEKLEQFSQYVFNEAKKHRTDILENITSDYNKSVKEYEEKTVVKYDTRFYDEINRIKRVAQKEVVEAQSDQKRDLIAKRTKMVNYVFDNVSKKLLDYFGTPDYLDGLMTLIKNNNIMGSDTIVYLVSRDMIHKEFIEKETSVKVLESPEDFFGGLKITLSDKRVANFTIKAKYDEEKLKFNKIRI